MTVEIGAEVVLSLTEKIDELNGWHKRIEKALHDREIAPVQVPLTAGAGTLDAPALLAPVRGDMWSVRRLTLWGYTAGTVTVTLNGLEPLFSGNPAMNTYGRGEVLLTASDKLVVTASGITGNVFIAGRADSFETWYLPFYLD